MKKSKILLIILLSLPYVGQAQFDTIYTEPVPYANEVLPALMVQGDEYWCFGKAFIGQDDYFRLKKVNANGEIVGQIDSAAYLPYLSAYACYAAKTDNGFVIANGYSDDNGMNVGKTIRFNSDLSIAWSNVETNVTTDTTEMYLTYAQEISDKSVIASGWYRWTDPNDNTNTLHGLALMKIDSLGNTVWIKTELQSTSTDGLGIFSSGVIELPDGELLHLRRYGGYVFYNSYLHLQRLSSGGDVIDEFTWDEAYHHGGPAAIVKGDYLYIVYCKQDEEVLWFDPLDSQCRFKKFNLLTWQEEWDVAMDIEILNEIGTVTYFVDMYELENGDLVALGAGAPHDYYDNSGFLFSFDLDGNINWQKVFESGYSLENGGISHYFHDMIVCPDGGFLITGTAESFIDGIGQKQHLIKTDPCGDVVYAGCPDGVLQHMIPKPSLTIYPNPASDLLNLSLNNIRSASQLSLYNAQGQLLHTSMLKPYQETLSIDVSAYQSGVYMVQLKTENGTSETVRWVKE